MSTDLFRIPPELASPLEDIDRAHPVAFRFDGKRLRGRAGDTLASALLANGVHLVGRGIKYHRPRGIVAAGAEEPNALVQVGQGTRGEPNLKATQVALFDNLSAAPVNVWPSLKFDALAANELLSPLMVAGFYYKTFKEGPASWWDRVYEPLIRRAAGWGKAPPGPDPDTYEHTHAHCDVLVIGAGPAGLSAAKAAAESGARVMVLEDDARPGGHLLARPRRVDGRPGHQWAAETAAALAAHPEVRLLTRTTALGVYATAHVTAVERLTDHLGPGAPGPRQRLWHIRAGRIVLASGAHERPLVFADNDRPGIMLAGAVGTYVHRYGVLPGRRAVILTNNDSAYETALALLDGGGSVVAVLDTRREPSGPLVEAVRARGVPIRAGYGITGTTGRGRVKRVWISPLAEDLSPRIAETTLDCDLVAVSGGFSPVVHLWSQGQGKLAWDDRQACFVPDPARPAVEPISVAGAANGCFELAEILAQGANAGAEAARAAGFTAKATTPPGVEAPPATPPAPIWLVPSDKPPGEGVGKHFVDLQNDTTAADIALAAREGMTSVELMKRYTLAGFGTDQGKTGNINALAILAHELGKPIPEVGTTTFRPPYTPLTFGAMAGRQVGALFAPERVTPMHDRHRARGAVFEDVGPWKRARYYPEGGEDMDAAVARECRAARQAVAVLDASTLGKIEVEGPDAAAFLDRVYTNTLSTLGVGRIRYGLMLNDDGRLMDDGTVTRLGEDRYLLTTTTGGAATVMDWLEELHQTEWPELDLHLTSVTDRWAVAQVAGPKARDLLAELAPDMDLSAQALPFMRFVEGTVAGLPARVFRISFTGELSFEVAVPWSVGGALWDALFKAGGKHGLTPFGTEAMHVLRAEKGFIIVGQETDGSVTPLDLGLDWALGKKKGDYIGRRSLARADLARDDRKHLVGLLTEDPGEVLEEGAQLVDDPDQAPPMTMVGHVTSSYMSPTLERSIALALVARGRQRMGQTVHAPLADGRVVKATIVDPVFYDKEGKRRDG